MIKKTFTNFARRHRLKFKSVMRLDRRARMLRLFRIMWVKGIVGDGKGYSAQFSVALRPSLFQFHKEFSSYFLTLFGLRLHFERSYGGTHC